MYHSNKQIPSEGGKRGEIRRCSKSYIRNTKNGGVGGSRSVVFPIGCKVELDKSWRHRKVVAEVGTFLLSCIHIHT